MCTYRSDSEESTVSPRTGLIFIITITMLIIIMIMMITVITVTVITVIVAEQS